MQSIASGRANLPDPARPGPAAEPFETGVAWDEAWWWLALPIATAVALVAAALYSREFYLNWVIHEPYGILEFMHFALPFAAFVIGFRLLMKRTVRARPLVLAFVAIASLACLFLAGEEVSWGQHFFHWVTPEGWVNRQNETNLHNSYWVLEKFPRILIETGIFVGGLLIPLWAWFDESIRRMRLGLFLPAAILVPVSLLAMGFKAIHTRVNDMPIFGETIPRPSEAAETFYVMFLLFYMIVFARRIRALENDTGI